MASTLRARGSCLGGETNDDAFTASETEWSVAERGNSVRIAKCGRPLCIPVRIGTYKVDVYKHCKTGHKSLVTELPVLQHNMPTVNKALILHAKDAGDFTLETRPVPSPGPGQVLVRVYAAALNPVDDWIRRFGFLVDNAGGFPAVPGR